MGLNEFNIRKALRKNTIRSGTTFGRWLFRCICHQEIKVKATYLHNNCCKL